MQVGGGRDPKWLGGGPRQPRSHPAAVNAARPSTQRPPGMIDRHIRIVPLRALVSRVFTIEKRASYDLRERGVNQGRFIPALSGGRRESWCIFCTQQGKWAADGKSTPLECFEVALFSTCVWAQKGGASSFLRIWAKWWLRRGPRQTLRKEPPVLIMQDALPLFKSFLKPVSLNQRAQQLVLRCVIAFLMHLGKMSASRVAGGVRTDARHRAQVSRFMGRRYWRRCDLLGQLRAQLLEMEARQGTFVFDIDQTYCSQQGKLTENTIIRGEKTKPREARTSRRSTRSGRPTVS